MVCLMATVPQGCFCPGAGHPQPQSHRDVPQGCPCPLWVTRGLQGVPFFCHGGPPSKSASPAPHLHSWSFPPSVSLRASPARLLSAMAAGRPEICLSQGARGSSAWLSSGAWWSPTLVSAVAGPSGGWHSAAHGFPPHQSPTQPPLLEPNPVCPTRGETYLKWVWEIRKLIFFQGVGRQWTEKGCSTQGRHTRSKGIAEIHLSLYR